MNFGDNRQIAYSYDALGRIVSRTATSGGAYAAGYGYVSGGYGTNSTTPLVGSISQPGMNLAYQYDSRGNITAETRNNLTTTYAYDALGQLIRVNDPHENATWVYDYDRGGNIVSKVKYAYTTGTLGAALETIPYTYGDANWKDKLTAFNGQAITYDAIGNPLTFGNASYEWQAGRQLKKITLQNSSQFGSVRVDSSMTAYHNPGTADAGDTFSLEEGVLKVTTPGGNPYALANGVLSASASDPSPTTVEFFYDHNGLRTKKVVTENGVTNTTEYTLHGKLITHLKQGSSEMHFFYDAQSRPAMVEFGGNTYTYVHNLQGDIVGIVDSAGAFVVEYKYDAWGKPIAWSYLTTAYETLGRLNPFRYRGYVYDEETGFYYVSSRYYNPEVGRYLNADSVLSGTGESVQGYNLFAYCFNNPVNMSDSSGHWPKWIENAANWVNNNIVQPVANFFSPKTNTISGQFQDGIFRGSGSLTGGYSEFNGRLQINSKDSKNNGMLGGYGKVSVGNASGKIGIGNDNAALSVKGVGDALTATAQAGIQYKNGAGLAAKAKAAVLSGRATAELELFGWQIEFGVSGDLLSVGAEAMIGVFPDEGFTAKASVGAGLFGGGFVFRVKPKQ